MVPQEILQQTNHRPWPLPGGPWLMQMRWRDLAFLHWPVPAARLRPLLPPALEIDCFEGEALVGVVPFEMDETRARFLPPVPTAHRFGEINVRTYVHARGRAGVWFFSLDAASRLAVRVARLIPLPYFPARIEIRRQGDEISYDSRRSPRVGPHGDFSARYRPTGAPANFPAGSLDRWLTERYCLFTATRRGRVLALDVHHLPWPLQPAEAEIRTNTMALVGGITLPDRPPLVHFARDLSVLAWAPKSLEQLP